MLKKGQEREIEKNRLNKREDLNGLVQVCDVNILLTEYTVICDDCIFIKFTLMS